MKTFNLNKVKIFTTTLLLSLILMATVVFAASINKKSVTIYTGQSTTLKLSGTTIKSVATSNKKIATITKKGVVKGIKAGKTSVSIKGKNNVVYKCSVTVKNPYISKTATAIYTGKSVTLKLYGTTIKSVASSNTKIATVTKKGIVKGVKGGNCTIALKGTNNKIYYCKLKVVNPYINTTSKSLYVGNTYQLKLSGTTIKSVSSSNIKIATISKAGTVKGINAGECYLYVKGTNNIVYKCRLKVVAPYLNKEKVEINKGKSETLKLSGTTIKLVQTTDAKVATVSKTGVVKAIGSGNCYIKITGVNNKVYMCYVTVPEEPEPTPTPESSPEPTPSVGPSSTPESIKTPTPTTPAPTIKPTEKPKIYLSETKIEMEYKKSKQLTLKGTSEKPIWISDSPTIASVSENGLVQGLLPGETKITALLNGKKYVCVVKLIHTRDLNSVCKHNWELYHTDPAMCYQPTRYCYKCTKCYITKAEFSGETIAHNFEYFSTMEANCQHEGYDRYRCDCGLFEERNIVQKIECKFEYYTDGQIKENGTWIPYQEYKCKWCENSYYIVNGEKKDKLR